jgi:hypothetical protein
MTSVLAQEVLLLRDLDLWRPGDAVSVFERPTPPRDSL